MTDFLVEEQMDADHLLFLKSSCSYWSLPWAYPAEPEVSKKTWISPQREGHGDPVAEPGVAGYTGNRTSAG